ncbi:leucine efflux protein LeuE [Solimonas marina]|uniref:Leucine efflux protein LeuE n=1 Tax=Solimonas marina TaxID=2714601 RepID=A0A969WAQ8_9GAMM|nr:leucine efflux protein LeuE [Solimonas marina]NKF22630.1 leucine efflux protein LeuE [Solimonas marina]
MLGITDITTYLLGVVVIVLLPGPNSMFVLSVAARSGVRRGYRAALGVFIGDALLMVLAAAGVASLLRAYPELFFGLKWAGAAYLAWLGANMLIAAWRGWRRDPAEVVASLPAAPVRDPLRRALTISLLNPKAILFFLSFFIQFVDRQYAHPALSFFVLGLIAQCVSFVYLSTLILFGHRLAATFRARRRLSAGATGGVGALFLSFSARLATAAVT